MESYEETRSKIERCEEDFKKTHHAPPDKIIISQQVYPHLLTQNVIPRTQWPKNFTDRDKLIGMYPIFLDFELPPENQSRLERQTSVMEIPVTFGRRKGPNAFEVMATYDFGVPLKEFMQGI